MGLVKLCRICVRPFGFGQLCPFSLEWKVIGLHRVLGDEELTPFLLSYRTLADRLLKMNLVPLRRLVKRDVSYEFMNRQMVWHAFTVRI